MSNILFTITPTNHFFTITHVVTGEILGYAGDYLRAYELGEAETQRMTAELEMDLQIIH